MNSTKTTIRRYCPEDLEAYVAQVEQEVRYIYVPTVVTGYVWRHRDHSALEVVRG